MCANHLINVSEQDFGHVLAAVEGNCNRLLAAFPTSQPPLYLGRLVDLTTTAYVDAWARLEMAAFGPDRAPGGGVRPWEGYNTAK